MGRIIIVNGSRKEGNYWSNEVRDNWLLLNTHCVAAMELAIARQRNDATYVTFAGEIIRHHGPIVLERWQPNRDFFTLYFEGASRRPNQILRTHAGTALALLKKGQHLVICDGGRPKHINMESRPYPSPSEVVEALHAANVERV
ncbi:hypothetical protein [Corallococcus exercitus]|uniref:Uncharacterized protein n=1 Tax=Corallococcus exercitus TaxID=2316736 RepID=A0A7Y4JPU9_9BACT|nr:hypothetical protein [Corallococcus exercitus]NOK08072.1 hypothetical protein [Corallococcus exercitus]